MTYVGTASDARTKGTIIGKPPTRWDAVPFWIGHVMTWTLYIFLTLLYIPWALAMHIVILALLLVTLPALYWSIPRKIHLYVYVIIIMVPGKFLWYNMWRYNRRKGQIWDYEMGKPQPVQVDKRRALSVIEIAETQPTSPLFLKIPPEIRMKIYSHVILGDSRTLMITGWQKKGLKQSKDIRIRAFPCHDIPTAEDRKDEAGQPSRSWAKYYASLYAQNPNHEFRMGLTLLQTCRQVYNEAINLYYTKPTFTFRDLHKPPFFLHTVLPHRLALIRSVHIVYDQSHMIMRTNHVACSTAKFYHKMGQCAFCNPIHWFNGINKYMTGLKDIHVHIFMRKDQRIPDMGKTWIARMLDLQTGPNGLRKMRVEVTPSFVSESPDRDLLSDEEEYMTKAGKFQEQLQQCLKKEVERHTTKHRIDSDRVRPVLKITSHEDNREALSSRQDTTSLAG